MRWNKQLQGDAEKVTRASEREGFDPEVLITGGGRATTLKTVGLIISGVNDQQAELEESIGKIENGRAENKKKLINKDAPLGRSYQKTAKKGTSANLAG